jgi:CubicO group peptidase (beta-lactamase class C family)
MATRPRAINKALLLAALMVSALACRTEEGGRMAAALDPIVAELFSLELAPGMAVVAVQGDEIVYAQGFGFADVEGQRPVTPETMFYIASTTKSFTAFAAALLADRGELDLDAPLSRYVPGLELRPPLSSDGITLRELLTHTHGIASGGPVSFRLAYTGEHTPDLLLGLLADHEPAESGKAFRYGNIGYNVAGLAMDAALEVGWKELLQREVFEPLEMENTSAYMSKVDPGQLALPYRADPEGFSERYYAKDDANMHSAGGHVTTVLDLARYLEAHLNEGRVDGRQLFPASAVAETHRLNAEQDRNFQSIHRYGWGLGWDLGTWEGDTLIHRFGGFAGFHSHLSFMPARDIGVAVLVNANGSGTFLAMLVARYIYDRLLEKPGLDEKYRATIAEARETAGQIRDRIRQDRERRAARPQTLPHPLEAYAGTYENRELGRMIWRVVDGALEVQMGVARSSVEVYNGEENQLRVELVGGGQVIGFSISGERADSLNYLGRVFVRSGG